MLAISDIPQIAPTAHTRVDVHHDEVRRAQVEQREVAKRVDLEDGAACAGSRGDVQKNSKARWEVVCVEELQHHGLRLRGHLHGEEHRTMCEAETEKPPAPAIEQLSQREETVVSVGDDDGGHVVVR